MRRAVRTARHRFSAGRMRALAASLVAAALSPGAAFGDDTKPVVVSYIADQADQAAARDVVAEAYRRIGVAVRFRGMQAAAALDAAQSGEVDGALNRIAGISRTRPELIQIPVPVHFIRGAAFSRRYRFPVLSWNSLESYRVGIVRGYVFAEQGTAGMDVRVAQDTGELVRWIDEGEVDVGVMPRVAALAAVRQEGRFEVAELEGVLETLLLYHYVNAERAELAARLEPVLKEMLVEGTTRRLLAEAQARELGGAP